jgi:hypothetical protein
MQKHIVGSVEITVTVTEGQYDPDLNYLQLALQEDKVTGVLMSDGTVVVTSTHEEIVVQAVVTEEVIFDMDGYYAYLRKQNKAKNPKSAGTINNHGEIVRE